MLPFGTFGFVSTPIILDCDPGIDDALAIAFATASPETDLVGLTTVAGTGGRPAAAPGARRRARARRLRPWRRGAARARADRGGRARDRFHHRHHRRRPRGHHAGRDRTADNHRAGAAP